MQHQIVKEVVAVGIPIAIVGFLLIYVNIVIAAQCQQMIKSKSYLHNFSISKYQSVRIDSYNFSDYKVANITIIAGCAFTNKTTGEGYTFG